MSGGRGAPRASAGRLRLRGSVHVRTLVGFEVPTTPNLTSVVRMSGYAPGTGQAPGHPLSDLSRPMSGAYCFAPSLDVLSELAGPDVDR